MRAARGTRNRCGPPTFAPVTWLGACDIGDSGRFDADDRPLGLATRHFLEASVVVHGLGPEPYVVVVGTSRLVDRIGLNQRGALFLGVCNGSSEERLCHT